MFKGHRGRGRQQQYGSRLRDRFNERGSRSPLGGARGRQITPQNNRGDINDRFDEDERRFYEYTRSGHDVPLWQNYKERVQLIEVDLLEEMEYYRQNPDKHPKYELEWKEYWNGRTEDLIRKGEDPLKYDIKVEFFAFWDIKLRDLFQDIFRKEKAQLRQQLEFLHGGQPSNKLMADIRPQTESVDLKTSTSNERNYGSIKQEKKFTSDSARSTSDVSVISVLRQLSVLENHLGSLGPKVVDLLSKALLLEKSSGADSVLSNQENCVLLETVKEKLKGLLQAGMMQQSMIVVTETAVSNIIKLLLKVPSGKDNQFNFDEKPSVSGKRPSNDKNPYPDEKKPHLDERQLYKSEKNDYRDERKAFGDERKPFGDERKPFGDERKPYGDERKPFGDERKPYGDDRKPYGDERIPYEDERSSYNYERNLYNQGNSFTDRSMPQNKRTYKVSDINYFVEKLGFLSRLSFLEKTAMAQEIASSLLLRRQTDIAENDLLELINIYTSRKQEPRNEFCSDEYFKPTTSDYQQRSSGYNRFSSADDLSPRKPSSAIPSLFDTPARAALDALYGNNQTGYSLYEQDTKKSSNPGGGNSAPVTYPLNSNPYQSGSRRKY